MPVYDYKCAEHGLFYDLAAMEHSHKPCACPQCGKKSPRVIMIPPGVLENSPLAKSQGLNEKAKHEPIVSTADSRQEASERKAHSHKHGKSCGCSNHEANQGSLKQQVIYLPDGSKVFPSQRPWMISH